MHLVPPQLRDSPFHFSTTQAWACDVAGCPYTYTAAHPSSHLPLLLPATDVDELLACGTPCEVGSLCAAHLATNPYNYGPCPQCGAGHLRLRGTRPRYSPLILVELGRVDGGARALHAWRRAHTHQAHAHPPHRSRARSPLTRTPTALAHAHRARGRMHYTQTQLACPPCTPFSPALLARPPYLPRSSRARWGNATQLASCCVLQTGGCRSRWWSERSASAQLPPRRGAYDDIAAGWSRATGVLDRRSSLQRRLPLVV